MIVLDIITSTEDGRNNFIPEPGQFLVCTDSKKLYLGDGKTVGGVATTKKAERLSSGLDDLGLRETLESHYVITIPDEKATSETEGTLFLITDETTSHPLYGAPTLPDANDHVVGDIVFVY